MKNSLRRHVSYSLGAVAAAAAVALLVPGVANAQTVSGWVGPLSANNINYLHYSTIDNAPGALAASSRIYTVDGNTVPAGDIGARARLFKSGALCKATNYVYSDTSSTQVIAATTGNCGTGSYNSHGYVQAWNGTQYAETFTFPSNPLNYTATSARSAQSAQPQVKSGVNSSGQTIGSADTKSPQEKLPTLVAAIATNGTSGYVLSSELDSPRPASPRSAVTVGKKTIKVYAEDGKTSVGVFEIS